MEQTASRGLWRPSPWIALSPDWPHISKNQTNLPPSPSCHPSPWPPISPQLPSSPSILPPPPPPPNSKSNHNSWSRGLASYQYTLNVHWLARPPKPKLFFFFFFQNGAFYSNLPKATEPSIYWCWLCKGRRRWRWCYDYTDYALVLMTRRHWQDYA